MEAVYEDDLNNKNEISISKHAYDRMKSRNGWNRKTAERMIDKVYTNGLRPDQVKGYLKRWVNNKSQHDIEGKEFVLFGEKLYVFCEGIVLTVLPIPTRRCVLHEVL